MNATDALIVAVLEDPRWRKVVRRAMRRAWREIPAGERSWHLVREIASARLRRILFALVQRFAATAGRAVRGPYGPAVRVLVELSPFSAHGVDLGRVASTLVDELGEPMALLERSLKRKTSALPAASPKL